MLETWGKLYESQRNIHEWVLHFTSILHLVIFEIHFSNFLSFQVITVGKIRETIGMFMLFMHEVHPTLDLVSPNLSLQPQHILLDLYHELIKCLVKEERYLYFQTSLFSRMGLTISYPVLSGNLPSCSGMIYLIEYSFSYFVFPYTNLSSH